MHVGWFVGFLTASHSELRREKRPARRLEMGVLRSRKIIDGELGEMMGEEHCDCGRV